MNLLCLNLHCFQEDYRIKKLELIGDYLVNKNIDVACFQEVAQLQHEEVLFDNVKPSNNILYIRDFIKEKYGIIYHLNFTFCKHSFKILDEGVGILSKNEIISHIDRCISNNCDIENWKTRRVGCYKTIIDGIKYNFYSSHLGFFNDKDEPYEQQLRKLNEFVELNMSDDSIDLICGDFNLPSTADEYQLFNKYGFKDLYLTIDGNNNEDYTFLLGSQLEKANQSQRIDYIFSKQNIIASEAKICFKEEIVSDHLGLHMKIKKTTNF